MVAPIDQTTRQYCTVADVTTRIDLKTLPSVNLDHLIRVATRRIEGYCDRVFTRVPAATETPDTEVRHFLGGGQTILSIDDLIEMDSMTIDDVAQTLTNFILMPFGKVPTTWLEYEAGGRWTRGADVAITGAWGFSETVPWDIWDACVALVARALERAKTAYQDASAIPDVGQLVYAKSIPADIKIVLDHYRKLPL
jgi:hypothetical protein